ncbi:Nuclear pore complex nucleoporin component [Rhizophlyctis rosea]|nr:Nuclear pore complex nucleoporin component [Rhizophlyctis rosea]
MSRQCSPLKALATRTEEETTAKLEAAMQKLLKINADIKAIPFVSQEEEYGYYQEQQSFLTKLEEENRRRRSEAQKYLAQLNAENSADDNRLAEAKRALEEERRKKEKAEQERAAAIAKAQEEEKRKKEEAEKARLAKEKAAADAAAKKEQEEKQKAAEKLKQQQQQQQASQAAAAPASVGPSAPTSKVGSTAAPGPPAPQANADPNAPDPSLAPPEAWKTASAYLARVKMIKEQVKPKVMNNPQLSAAFFSARMEINARIGQQSVSQKKIIEIAQNVNKWLVGAQKDSNEVYEFLLDFTAKAIVKQAEKEVAVKSSQAFPLALISVILFNKHVPLLDILLGRMMKKCPYLIPQYFRKKPGETTEQQMTRAGYKKEDDTWETEEQFWERMGGIIALYGAICQTKLVPHNYGMSNAWVWLARILNMKPRKITPLLLFKFLEAVGFQLQQDYSNQTRKILQYIFEQYVPLMEKMPKAPTPSIIRLKSFIFDNYIQKGAFDEPAGHKLDP